MLIEKIREVYREFIDPVVVVEPMESNEVVRSASNASHYSRSGAQARRLRRQRRLDRATRQRMNGWAVRTW
ncbi:MAG: hypothetical protein KJO70_04260 [Gammaproteobacteria bacterium]|nr:hypothetical protein [Gammaproteobacteria bacterium]